MFSRLFASAARSTVRRGASYSTAAGANPLKAAKKSSDVVWLAGSVAVFGPTIFYLTSPPNHANAHHTEHAKPAFKPAKAAAKKEEPIEAAEEEEEQAAEDVQEDAPAAVVEEEKEEAAPAAAEEEPKEDKDAADDKPTKEAVKDGVQVAKTSHDGKPKDVHEATKASVQEHHAKKAEEEDAK